MGLDRPAATGGRVRTGRRGDPVVGASEQNRWVPPAVTPPPSTRELEKRLASTPAAGSFSESELEGLPDPVRRYLSTAVAPGTALAAAARFRMQGSIKVGKRWLPFRAREVLAPHEGFVWAARAGRVIVGSDRYVDGRGGMDWRILGLVRVIHADGPDLSPGDAGTSSITRNTTPGPCPRQESNLRHTV